MNNFKCRFNVIMMPSSWKKIQCYWNWYQDMLESWMYRICSKILHVNIEIYNIWDCTVLLAPCFHIYLTLLVRRIKYERIQVILCLHISKIWTFSQNVRSYDQHFLYLPLLFSSLYVVVIWRHHITTCNLNHPFKSNIQLQVKPDLAWKMIEMYAKLHMCAQKDDLFYSNSGQIL